MATTYTSRDLRRCIEVPIKLASTKDATDSTTDVRDALNSEDQFNEFSKSLEPNYISSKICQEFLSDQTFFRFKPLYLFRGKLYFLKLFKPCTLRIP